MDPDKRRFPSAPDYSGVDQDSLVAAIWLADPLADDAWEPINADKKNPGLPRNDAAK